MGCQWEPPGAPAQVSLQVTLDLHTASRQPHERRQWKTTPLSPRAPRTPQIPALCCLHLLLGTAQQPLTQTPPGLSTGARMSFETCTSSHAVLPNTPVDQPPSPSTFGTRVCGPLRYNSRSMPHTIHVLVFNIIRVV